MACDRDRITFTDEDVVNLLISYKDLKKESAILDAPNERIEFLERCLRYLDDYERDILEKTYIEGVSMRKYSFYSGFSRSFIAKQRQRSVALITKFFNVKYN